MSKNIATKLLNTKTVAVGAGVAVAAIAVYFIGKKAASSVGSATKEAAEKAGAAINPVSQDNIFNRGFTSVWQAITGDDSTLGTKIFDWLHPDQQLIDDASSRPGQFVDKQEMI